MGVEEGQLALVVHPGLQVGKPVVLSQISPCLQAIPASKQFFSLHCFVTVLHIGVYEGQLALVVHPDLQNGGYKLVSHMYPTLHLYWFP